MKTSISFLKSNYDFEKTLDLIAKSTADYIHVDVMDGLFVNNKTNFTKKMIEVLKVNPKPKDVHLMTLHLKCYIDVFSYVNPEYITFAFEAASNPDEIISYIKEKDIKVGIAINPFTDVNVLEPYLNKIDLILVMSVIPGYGGQKFIINTTDKIKQLNKLKKENKAKFKISVDGGIDEESIKKIDKEKVDMVVSGSFICTSADYDKQIEKLIK